MQRIAKKITGQHLQINEEIFSLFDDGVMRSYYVIAIRSLRNYKGLVASSVPLTLWLYDLILYLSAHSIPAFRSAWPPGETPSHGEIWITFSALVLIKYRLCWSEICLTVPPFTIRSELVHSVSKKVSEISFQLWGKSVMDILTADLWLQSELIRLMSVSLRHYSIQQLDQNGTFIG